MADRTFYKRTITLEFLSEEPIPGEMGVECLVNEANIGSYSMRIARDIETKLNGKQTARELLKQGSSPGFFSLNEKGEDANE